MKTCCIILTYQNRYKFLIKVVKRVVSENISKIIIIDNNSNPSSKVKIQELSKFYSCVEVIHFKRNMGTAYAIKYALKIVKKIKNISFVWILDDDNLPKIGSKKLLIKYFNNLKKNFNYVFTPIRYRLPQYQKYLKGNYNFKFYENNFIKFNFLRAILKFFAIKKKTKTLNKYQVKTAPYGGLFFHKSLLNKVGYPNVKMNTYSDDLEYTFRMSKKKCRILLCKSYLVYDIDKTFGEKNYFQKNFNEKKIYLQLRNHTFFSRRFITNLFIYKANMYFFIVYFIIKNFYNVIDPIFFFKRVCIILKAINDGNKFLKND
jgi:GT2 family glycosyltransferase